MNEFEVLVLAVALALDAMLVSFSYGLIFDKKKIFYSTLLSFSFGLFQFLMPLIGCYLTGFLYDKLEIYSKWIVFVIFLILGLKFFKSAIYEKEEEKIHCISFCCLLSLAIATSIDAMGAGVSFRFFDINCFESSILIGVVTFMLSFVGFWIANLLKKIPSKLVEIMGSALLIYLAIKSIL